MKNLALVLIVMSCSLFSCHKDDEQGIIIDIDISLSIESSDGADLLNPLTPKAIKAEDIKVFYEDPDGHRETYASTSGGAGIILDNPSGFTINPPEYSGTNRWALNIFSNGKSGKSVTVIALAGRGEIKLTAEVVKTNNALRIEKIWYKDNLVWPVPSNDSYKYVKVVL